MAILPNMQYPYVNGDMTEYADINLTIGVATIAGIPITGFESINYDWMFNGQKVHGAARSQLGKTLGQVSNSGSIVLLKDTYDTLVSALQLQATGTGIGSGATPVGANAGGGFGQVFFNVLLKFSFAGATDITSVQMLGCTLHSARAAHSQGGAALTMHVDLEPVILLVDDWSPANDLPKLLAASALFTGPAAAQLVANALVP